MSAYTIVTEDLTVSHSQQQLVPAGTPIAAIYVIDLPTPCQLHFGASGSPWDIERGKSYEPCPSERDGLFLTNLAGGGALKLGVSYEEGAVSAQ